MAKHVISTDQTDTVMVNTMKDLWVINQDVTITVSNKYGILESGGGSNTINVLGDVMASGTGYAGIRFDGAGTELDIGGKAVIDGSKTDSGIQYDGAGGHINIDGVVKGGDEAIHGNIWAVVQNHGTLSGNGGIIFDDAGSDITNFGTIDANKVGISSQAAGTLIVNDVGAAITSGSVGITLGGMSGDEAVIANKGVINADVAISDSDDNLTLTNTGKIVGDVFLGKGDDWFDTRHGTFSGTVDGGDGDDTFVVSSQKTDIDEAFGGGTDTVRSSVSYHLKGALDDLVLLGKKDLDGTGSKYDNAMQGNKGDNELVGLNGNDTLNGAKGNDTMEGDLGFDTFVFNAGSGKDHIVDFIDGEDHIKSNLVTTMTDFNNLTIKQDGADTVIHFAGGDTLTLDHFVAKNLDYGDFV